MTVTLAPGDLGIDIAGFRLDSATKIAQAKQAGCKFVLRYSAGVGNTSNPATKFKLITPAEFKSLIAAGFDVIANSEWYESRITEGASAGKADGAADLALWRSCGLAQGATIYVSWDQGPTTARYDAVAAYLTAYQASLNNYYHVDIYAGSPVIMEMMRRKLISKGWRPNAGSWSNDGLEYQPDLRTPQLRATAVANAVKHTQAHIWQTGNYWFSQQADENIILRVPVGSHWDAVRAQKPAPKPVPDTPGTKPAQKPILRENWPLKGNNVFGPITGPANVHGGIDRQERIYVGAIQHRLEALKFAPAVAGWADGVWAESTTAAFKAFQTAHKVPVNGICDQRNWNILFTY